MMRSMRFVTAGLIAFGLFHGGVASAECRRDGGLEYNCRGCDATGHCQMCGAFFILDPAGHAVSMCLPYYEA
jgi:hypothetical protein